MKKYKFEARELFQLTAVCIVLTAIALVRSHSRAYFMLFLTALLALITFVAQYRKQRTVRTLDRKGRRKQRPDA